MINKDDLIEVFEAHVGKARGIKARALADKLGIAERTVRQLITELREDSVAVCGHPTSGYYLAQTSAELEETLAFLRRRALHSLKLASTLSKLPLAVIVGQLQLNI